MAKTSNKTSAKLVSAKKPRHQHPRTNAHTIDQFLDLLNQNFSQRAAARICRLGEKSVTRLLSQPSVKERQEELRQLGTGNLRVANGAEQAKAEVGHARAELCEMAVYGEQKKPGRLRACSLLLQSHGLVDAPGPKAFSASQSSAVIGTGTMEEIYKSQWLRDKEAALAARFEQELVPKQLTP